MLGTYIEIKVECEIFIDIINLTTVHRYYKNYGNLKKVHLIKFSVN